MRSERRSRQRFVAAGEGSFRLQSLDVDGREVADGGALDDGAFGAEA